MGQRKEIPNDIQVRVLTSSRRRCALCVGVNRNEDERLGQIAHLNGDNSDNRFDNLVWLCLEHHNQFDSRTSQTKNYMAKEVKEYRDDLYKNNSHLKYTMDDIKSVSECLKAYGPLFGYLFRENSELAFTIKFIAIDEMERFVYSYDTSLRYSSKGISDIFERIAHCFRALHSVYHLDMYNAVGENLIFNSAKYSVSDLDCQKRAVQQIVDAIRSEYDKLVVMV